MRKNTYDVLTQIRIAAAKSEQVIRLVLLKVTYDRKMKRGLPDLEESRQAGELTVFKHLKSNLKNTGDHRCWR